MRAPASLLVATLFAGALLGAQQPGSSSVVLGRVHRSGDSTLAVAGAEVSLDANGADTKTGSDGHFTLTGIAPGPHQLRVKSIGYQPASIAISVAGDTTRVPPIALVRAAQELGQVVVAGRTITYPLHFSQQYKRAAGGRGHFFTAEQIDSLHPVSTAALLSLIPTVSVSDNGISFAKCTSSISGLGASSGISGSGASSNVMVYVDGVRLTRSNGDDAAHILRDVRPQSIQLIEVYSGTSSIPGEFLEDACAVILVWTKRY